MKEKISLFCDVDKEAVIEARDTETIYEVPLHSKTRVLPISSSKRLGLAAERAQHGRVGELIRRIK